MKRGTNAPCKSSASDHFQQRMSTPIFQPGPKQLASLEEMVGYLNFSSGARDAKFLRNLNELFRFIEPQTNATCRPVDVLCRWLEDRMGQLSVVSPAFAEIEQARAIVRLLRDHLLPAYRSFHRDLLWHQTDAELWRPFFLGCAWEALLRQGGPWNETDRIIRGALEHLNDYIGYRPVAVLESERQMEPYANEWVCPIPLYIQGVGVACGAYEELIERATAILADTDPDIRQQAWFDFQLVEELSLDPRAYDFDHPASKRPNHHFGQWDLHRVDHRGFYRRFIVQQITLDALMSRVNSASQVVQGPDGTSATREELLFEAAAVLAGTILMASGTTGNGPGCHASDVTLSSLLPHIASYRDQFYEELLARTDGRHGARLRAEAARTRQPFGGARQHLNHELARRRAAQMQRVHLALLYARMGYPSAAVEEAHAVRITSARMLCQIYCLLTTGHQLIDARQLDVVAQQLSEIEDLLRRGIECGALVDPWNIVGFGGNFSLFPAPENTVRDFRVDDLIELVEQLFGLVARAWTEAAAVDDAAHEAVFSAALERLATWWDKYATASVSGIKRLVGKEIEVSTNLVAGALAAWHKAGAAAGDIKYWRLFVDQFDSPKAFQLVVEALLERGDLVASMALMLQWVSQAETTALQDGDASFHSLALRWLRSVEAEQRVTGTNQWPLVAKFLEHLEASAEEFWQVPEFELSSSASELEDLSRGDTPKANHAGNEQDASWKDEDEELFSAAYEDMVYRDSTDDGYDAEVLDEFGKQSQYELEEEAQRLGQRLEFLTTVARLWRYAVIAWGTDGQHQTWKKTRHRDATAAHDRHQATSGLLEGWYQQAVSRYDRLLELLEKAHRFPLPQPGSAHESMLEFDRQRIIKESLLEQIISTCVETANAGRLLLAASSTGTDATDAGGRAEPDPSIAVLRGVLAADAAAVKRHWPAFTQWLAEHELLYVPLGKGGRPHRIVRARQLSQFLDDLLGWLPCLGLVRETCQLLDLAQGMETEHPVGPGAITEYDRLFMRGYQAIVRALVVSADEWDTGLRKSAEKKQGAGRRRNRVGQFSSSLPVSPPAVARLDVQPSDFMLIEALQELTESQLHRWLIHSRTLRLSVVERLTSETEWNGFVAFIKRYGGDIFTQKFLNLGNLRAILHQRASVWLSNLERDSQYDDWRLTSELGTVISHEEAAKWLTVAIEAIVENYREYRDYNTTTTQSDHGELLYTLIDFLRLRVAYDRVAWNLRPVVIAHEVLVRQNRPIAAEMWRHALTERTAETADANLARFEELCNQYGFRLPTIAERLSERFTRPLAIDRVRALVGPAVAAAGTDETAPFNALKEEIADLAEEPSGAGLDLPDWLEALEEEVSSVRCKRRNEQAADDIPQGLEQVRLSWDEWQQQIADDSR